MSSLLSKSVVVSLPLVLVFVSGCRPLNGDDHDGDVSEVDGDSSEADVGSGDGDADADADESRDAEIDAE